MSIFANTVIMSKLAKSATLAGLLLLVFACGRVSSPSSSIAQSRSGGDEPLPTNPSSYDLAQPRFIVPPELAMMTISITATETSFAASTQLVQTATTTLLDAVNAGSGCSAQISHYLQPVQPLGTYLRPEDNQYTSQMTVEMEIDFAGMSKVGDRIQRLDDCLGRIPDLVAQENKENEAVSMTLSTVIPTIRDASIHREALLQQHFKTLQGVAVADQPPSQFQPEKTICTSDGTVSVVAHQLSGIELDVNFDCYLEDRGDKVINAPADGISG